MCTSLVILILSDELARLLAADGTAALVDATTYVLRFAAFAIVLNVIGDYTGYILALRGRFVIAVAAPIANAFIGALISLCMAGG